VQHSGVVGSQLPLADAGDAGPVNRGDPQRGDRVVAGDQIHEKDQQRERGVPDVDGPHDRDRCLPPQRGVLHGDLVTSEIQRPLSVVIGEARSAVDPGQRQGDRQVCP